MDALLKDPVCGMQVSADQHPLDYMGVHYAFCSQQCQDRFRANPHLYVGVPGEKAPRQSGMEVVKKRRLRLGQPLTAPDQQMIGAALRQMMGIRAVEFSGDSIEISYDLLLATARQIEEKLEAIGVQVGPGWADQLRRAFVNYEEECEIDNLEVNPKRPGHYPEG